MLGTYDSKDDFPLRKTGTERGRGFEVLLLPGFHIPPRIKSSHPPHVLRGALIFLFPLALAIEMAYWVSKSGTGGLEGAPKIVI